MAGLRSTPQVELACRGRFGCAGFGCLVPVVEAESMRLAGSKSLVGSRGLVRSSDPAKRVPSSGAAPAPLFLKRIRVPLPAQGSSPPTVVPEAMKVRCLWMGGPSQFPP